MPRKKLPERQARRATEGQENIAPTGNTPQTVIQLQELQVRRKFYIRVINRAKNSCAALARRYLGFQWDLPQKERDAISERALRAVTAAIAGKPWDKELEPIAADLGTMRAMIAPAQEQRDVIEKEMKVLARTLPGAEFQRTVKGFGELALAVLVGEAGNLSAYPTDDKLRKRLGLAPFDGFAYSSWRKKRGDRSLSEDEWTQAGYKPARLAEIFSCLTEPLFKHQWMGEKRSGVEGGKPVGRYGEIYAARRARTATSHPDWTPKHSQMDGLRVMTQKLIADLWVAWREGDQLRIAEQSARTIASPSANSLSSQATERSLGHTDGANMAKCWLPTSESIPPKGGAAAKTITPKGNSLIAAAQIQPMKAKVPLPKSAAPCVPSSAEPHSASDDEAKKSVSIETSGILPRSVAQPIQPKAKGHKPKLRAKRNLLAAEPLQPSKVTGRLSNRTKGRIPKTADPSSQIEREAIARVRKNSAKAYSLPARPNSASDEAKVDLAKRPNPVVPADAEIIQP